MADTNSGGAIGALNEQLIDAAANFAGDAGAFAGLLTRFARDIERARSEPLTVFPVCHHSPAAALHMARLLRDRPPRAIYLELCEDMQPLAEHLRDCTLPVALQTFAAESDVLPPELLPVSVVAPLTEASAEYQAIAFALNHPDTHLVFVDRAADYVFQWDADWQRKMRPDDEDAAASGEGALHGTAVGVAVGELAPTFDAFLQFLLRNSRTRHFSEWWEQYVERAIIGAPFDTYREAMVLLGSLIRNLGQRRRDTDEDRLRERYMWTRIKQHMRAHNVQPADALYICGAAHAASDVPEWGTASDAEWDIPPASNTRWLHGIIPSSYAAIEHQFSFPPGSVGLAEESWQKALKTSGVRPFSAKKPENARRASAPAPSHGPRALVALLTRPPESAADHEQLLGWSAQITALARRNGYLASTADSIAIFQTALMLAQLRNRPHPSAFDFQDAAITCLEKDRTPKKRTIAQLCQIMLGGDRVGAVGYSSLPPLVQDMYDRLAPLGLSLQARTNQRALMDFRARPELRACADVLWQLHYLLGDGVVEPIIGERALGQTPLQESWDIRIGREQRSVIQLGYEGVTLEQVLEQRMKRAAFGEGATAARALQAAEDALLYMASPRLVGELGAQATRLLADEAGAHDAPDIFRRARRLVHHYRAGTGGLPTWLAQFVATGYAHYAALLPQSFADRGTAPQQIAGMLGFIFTLESFALALGSQRNQLLVGVQQAGQQDVPTDKLGLLWAAEWLLGLRAAPAMRAHFHALLADGLRLPTLPGYLSGYVLALTFAPGIARLVVELISAVFGAVPDRVLLPLLPGLLLQLREYPALLQPLIKEAAGVFPASLAQFAGWRPAWMEAAPERPSHAAPPSDDETAARLLLFAAPATTSALAAWLGVEPAGWQERPGDAGDARLSDDERAVRELLLGAPATAAALGRYLDAGDGAAGE
jgi:hypothetical protein